MADTNVFRQAVIDYLKPSEGNFNYEYMLDGHLDASRFEILVKQVEPYRPIAGSRVLSSGCGSAGDLWAFMRAGAARGFGIEVTDDLAQLARERFRGTEFEPAVQIDVYDGSVLPYQPDMFDIIYSMHVIEHTPGPAQYLDELCRVLRPGGIIFMDVPNRYYKLEQHSGVPYIHFPPVRLRNLILRVLLSKPIAPHLSADTRYKLSTYFNYQIPSAAQLMRIYRTAQQRYGLQLRAAFFHSSGGEHVPYRAYPGKYFFGRAHTMITFRMVIGKK